MAIIYDQMTDEQRRQALSFAQAQPDAPAYVLDPTQEDPSLKALREGQLRQQQMQARVAAAQGYTYTPERDYSKPGQYLNSPYYKQMIEQSWDKLSQGMVVPTRPGQQAAAIAQGTNNQIARNNQMMERLRSTNYGAQDRHSIINSIRNRRAPQQYTGTMISYRQPTTAPEPPVQAVVDQYREVGG